MQATGTENIVNTKTVAAATTNHAHAALVEVATALVEKRATQLAVINSTEVVRRFFKCQGVILKKGLERNFQSF